nr:hypothetical protein [Tanacetum cinerariifolium]
MGEQQTKKGEDGPEWVVRSKFENELANFMLKKKFHMKRIREMLDQHRKEMHEQFFQIFSTIRKSKILEPEALTFAITTRSRVSTRDPPFPAPSQSTPANHAEGATEKERLEGAESSIIQDEEALDHSFFINPQSRQIHINLPFLEAMIHMPKGAKVLKDLLSHKENLKKSVSSVKLSEECFAIIQTSLPQKEGDP